MSGAGNAPHAAIVGGGWAGFAAALTLAQAGWRIRLHEAAREPGGRARGMDLETPQGRLRVDNGQHILIGAYTESLRLMRAVGVDPGQALHRQPMALPYADGSGLRFPDWPAPFDALAGIATARGWSMAERLALLARAARWRLTGFRCAPETTVAILCAGLPRRLLDEFIDPLCISALNTPMEQASATVFLRVLRDALFSGRGGSHFLVPRQDLGSLFPIPAAQWLAQRGHCIELGSRITELQPQGPQWMLDGDERFEAVLLACPAAEASRLALAASSHPSLPAREGVALQAWAKQAEALPHRPIATVYAQTADASHALPPGQPWLALRCAPEAPAQFVFDRGQLGGPQGLMAFVISDSAAPRARLQAQVLAQAQEQLGWHGLTALRTVIDKRATFSCLPLLHRPGLSLGHGLWACGDYLQGPYPATIEGAVRSGIQAAQAIAAAHRA
ncbi:hydroxysqualene dehydroxylase HpnE [Delftia sp. PS-11]|uniref:hydroxysqualene dehydroxylase HpnE n=1 Tax=Delftia sp. PS-11 TaxID=2767222 RepID=UPI00245427EB|nr:hydroxysqualene dehydroxylase HpnE [Delftia sp. PS-11]